MKLGVALGGGGARGIAHIGALRVLEAARLPIDLIAGTSAGAIIGALYAAGKPLAEIEVVVRGIRLRHWAVRDHTGTGLFGTAGIRRIVEAAIGKDTRIEDLARPFAAVAVDLDAQTQVVFDSGPVADAVCASAAFPGLFAPVRVGERHLIDGGALNPVPFDVARRMGADVVLAIDLGAEEPLFTAGSLLPHRRNGWVFHLLLTAEQQKIFRVVARAIGIMTRQLRAEKIKQSPPDLIIYPDVRNVGLMDFDLADVCLAAGESATRAALPQIETLCSSSRRGQWQRAWRRMTRRLSGRA